MLVISKISKKFYEFAEKYKKYRRKKFLFLSRSHKFEKNLRLLENAEILVKKTIELFTEKFSENLDEEFFFDIGKFLEKLNTW